MEEESNVCSKTKVLDEKEKQIILDYIACYDNFLNKVSNDVKDSCRKLDAQDIKQQIILTLFTSVKHYDGKLGASYSTYLSQIAINAGKNIIRAYWQDKNRAYAEAISLDSFINEDNGDDSFISLVSEDETSFLHPKSIYETNEMINIINNVSKELSDFEKEVLSLYLSGETMDTIAKKTNKSNKKIYNTIFKLKSLFFEQFNQK